MRFVDTNVLLYAISTDPDEAAKATAARAILESADLALSVQVIQEFYVQATRPTRQYPLTHEQASLLVEAWLRFPVQDITVPIMLAAAATAQACHICTGMPPSSKPRGLSAARPYSPRTSRTGGTTAASTSRTRSERRPDTLAAPPSGFHTGNETGITRGRKLVVLVGQSKALAIAVRGSRAVRRWSKLGEWLRSGTTETMRCTGLP